MKQRFLAILVCALFLPFLGTAQAVTAEQVIDMVKDIGGGGVPYVCVDPFADFGPTGPNEYQASASLYVCVDDKRYGTSLTVPIRPGVGVCYGPEAGYGQGSAPGSVSYRVAVGVLANGQCVLVDEDGETPGVPQPVVCESASSLSPNGDLSYHYRLGATASVNGGPCAGHVAEGDTPRIRVCEVRYDLEPAYWYDNAYYYDLGATVSLNGGPCIGYTTSGFLGLPYCGDDVDLYPNGDGTWHYEAYVYYRYLPTSRGCNSAGAGGDTPAPPTVTVCEGPIVQATPQPGRIDYTIALKVRVNSGACTGVYQSGSIPIASLCQTPEADVQPGDDTDDFSYAVNTGLCLPGQTEPVAKSGYFQGPLQD